MREDLKKHWITALRSEKYKQGKRALYDKRSDSYCCLGVLCEISGLKKESFSSASSVMKYTFDNNSCSAFLPPAFTVYAELPFPVQFKLQDMNDNQECSFDDIADFIEETL